MWNGNSQVFRTYVETRKNKDGDISPICKVKGVQQISTLDEVRNCDSYSALLNSGYIDISFDTEDLSDKFWTMADENQWNCLIQENPSNGHIHSFWKIPENMKFKDGKDKKLAVGLIADIHSGDTHIRLKVEGVEREIIYEPSESVQEVPEELFPVDTDIDLLNLSEGDGRNDSFFRYILILQSKLGLDKETIKRILKNTNDFILSDPLSEQEFDTITRDEAFEKPIFFSGRTFLFNAFGDYLIRNYYMVKMDGRLHIFDEGVYSCDLNQIERIMLKEIPTITDTKRKEVLKYLNVMCPEVYPSDPRYIAFRNGVLDIETGELHPFSPEYVVTNRIPWDYNPSAYSELADSTLNKMTCNDPDIRSLLEECIGYTFYRMNSIRKAFILTGAGSNGKSTFIAVLNKILGDENVSALDLKNLGDRFSKAVLFKKLANIGDDISDEFIPDPSLFKKIVSGDKIDAEFKGQDAFEFNPYVKLVFSANSIPRMKDKTGAVINRLVIIPFDAMFSENDPDFDPDIKRKLASASSVEYFIRIGVEGLKRVLKNKRFSKSSKVDKELEEYKEFNNPVLGFIKEMDEGYLFRTTTSEIYCAYQVYCSESGLIAESKNQFGRTLKAMFNIKSVQKTICGKSVRMYQKVSE